MKHGISPTGANPAIRSTIIHLSKALVFRVVDPSTADENGKVKVQYLPLHIQPPPDCIVSVVVAPDKGVTAKRKEPKQLRPGLRRRYALSGRELTSDRVELYRMQLPRSAWDFI